MGVAPVCGLAPMLDEAEQAFQAVLQQYTLKDVLDARSRRKYREFLPPA